jgi:hypothetical protein
MTLQTTLVDQLVGMLATYSDAELIDLHQCLVDCDDVDRVGADTVIGWCLAVAADRRLEMPCRHGSNADLTNIYQVW